MSIQFGKINNNIFVNSTATYENGIVSISSPENAEKINFYAPSNANSSDLYEINGRQVILSNILNNNPEITWVKDAPISAVYDSENNKLFINSINGENSLFSNLFRNANAEVVENKVVINSVKEAVDLFNFYSIKEYSASDIYEVNGQVYEVVDLNGGKLEEGWISNVPVSLVLNDNRLWYSSNGSYKLPNDLPPLNPNFTINFSGTTVTVTANKLPANDKTSMLAGGVWVLGSTIPDSPKGTIVKNWTKSQLIDSTQNVESDETVTWAYSNWTAGEPIYCRQYTYNEKEQYNTSLYGGLVSTEDVTFQLPEFTGNHAIFGDETEGRIELYESGTLTLYPGTYDFFLVGGGAGSRKVPYDSTTYDAVGGAGSGYTITKKNLVIDRKRALTVIVGAGGLGDTTGFSGTPGTATEIDFISEKVTADGGKSTNYTDGSSHWQSGLDGGSGGGGWCWSTTIPSGGSDGANGGNGRNSRYTFYGGKGQGKTTRAFEEENQTLYAGGGSGGSYDDAAAGAPGAGGGGRGAARSNGRQATAGTPNTGGGGGGNARWSSSSVNGLAGGSGIIIIRWNNT